MNPDLHQTNVVLERIAATLQKGAWDHASAVAIILTLVVVLVYTVETYKLRRAAQAQTDETRRLLKEAKIQNERSILPVVTIEGARGIPVSEGANMPAFQTVISNLGSGPAFNISIDPLRGPGAAIRFEHTTALAPGDQQPIWMVVTEDGKQVTSGAYRHIQRMFHNNQLVSGSSSTLRYSDINGSGIELS